MKINENEFIWVEKYRPQTINDILLPESVKAIFKGYIDSNEIPNLLLTSTSPGLGKTSIAKILVKDTNADMMFLNGNLDTGVDIMRSRVIDFCSGASFDESPRVVLIDECLEENERIKTPSGSIALKEIKEGEFIECYSLNRNTGNIEIDKASVISSKQEEIFEVTMDDGRVIKVTENHPFICKNSDGYYIKSIQDGLSDADNIVDFFEFKGETISDTTTSLNSVISKEHLEKIQKIHPNVDFVVRCALEEFLSKRL